MVMRTVGFKAPEALIELLDKLVEDGSIRVEERR